MKIDTEGWINWVHSQETVSKLQLKYRSRSSYPPLDTGSIDIVSDYMKRLPRLESEKVLYKLVDLKHKSCLIYTDIEIYKYMCIHMTDQLGIAGKIQLYYPI